MWLLKSGSLLVIITYILIVKTVTLRIITLTHEHFSICGNFLTIHKKRFFLGIHTNQRWKNLAGKSTFILVASTLQVILRPLAPRRLWGITKKRPPNHHCPLTPQVVRCHDPPTKSIRGSDRWSFMPSSGFNTRSVNSETASMQTRSCWRFREESYFVLAQ